MAFSRLSSHMTLEHAPMSLITSGETNEREVLKVYNDTFEKYAGPDAGLELV